MFTSAKEGSGVSVIGFRRTQLQAHTPQSCQVHTIPK